MPSVKVAVDVHGGDNAPSCVLDGVSEALSADSDLEVILCGMADVVESFAEGHDRCIPYPTSQIIQMSEHPVSAVRKKKDSSIVAGCRLVSEGKAQGFFSAGSTGAVLAASVLGIGRIKGVARPALSVRIPAGSHPVLLLDVGASADWKPEYLVQYAIFGTAYSRLVMNVENPSVALLNIGSEDSKGSVAVQEAYRLLMKKVPGFAGNCEGDDITRGTYDVVVTDGFTGNVVLKTIEGTAKMILKSISGAIHSSVRTKLAGAMLKSSLYGLRDSLDPNKVGGTPLLGIKGVSLIGHGSSNAQAIEAGILATRDCIQSNLVQTIEGGIDL